jgi:NAD(P)-dependent dehydrogenase (short-subunit alcohol dehydrogenase family)
MEHDLVGKTFLVTGATEGIGKAAAREFVARGAQVSIVGRNPEKSERVVKELQSAGPAPVDLYLADLSNLSEVRKVAQAFLERHDKLDVLVNNAGAYFAKRQLTADGFEMTFALNHLSPFLLTKLLSDLLRRTRGARVITTSSNAHAMGGTFDLADVATRERRGTAGFRAYADSKLANVLFTRELAKRLGPAGVMVTCFHPGYVHTGFGQNNPGFVSALMRVVSPIIARTPVKGAETLVWLATTPDVTDFGGKYFVDRKSRRISKQGLDDTLATALWEQSEALVAPSSVSAAVVAKTA